MLVNHGSQIRYPANPRSLGMKYPNVCSGENCRPKGVLCWLCDRAGKRLVRGKNVNKEYEPST